MYTSKLSKMYRLKTTQRQIITWLSYNIKPSRVRKTVQGILKQQTRRGQRADKKLKCFHKFLMKVAKTFHESFELGLTEKTSSGSNNSSNNGGRMTGLMMEVITPVGNVIRTTTIMTKIEMEDEITKCGKIMAETIKTGRKRGPHLI